MPVRSIKVKLIVPRKHVELYAARDLWATHAAINEATCYYETRLLELRGRGYTLNGGCAVTQETVAAQLDQTIDEARQRNGQESCLHPAQLAEVRQKLRWLYETIVPSSVGKKGTAQVANGYLSPLTDATSRGYQSTFAKIEEPPPWLEGVRAGDDEAVAAAGRWAATVEGWARLHESGAPTTWVRKWRQGDPDWPAAFVADYDKKRQEAPEVPTIIKSLKEAGVLPLFPPYLTPKITTARSTLSPWDRLAFRLAVGHLLSWESWDIRDALNHETRRQQVADFKDTFLDRPELAPAIAALNRYETERAAELAAISLAPLGLCRINRRMVRHWPDLRERWRKSKVQSKGALLALSAAEQTRLRGAFGDPHFFAWLAEPANHHVWHSDPDVVSLLAHYNDLLARYNRSKDYATMTLPDARRHPRSMEWEPEGGSNLRKYRLVAENGNLRASLPLLHPTGTGGVTEVTHTFAIAPTTQFQRILFDRVEQRISLTYENQSGEVFTGQLKSSDLRFDWDYTRSHAVAALERGAVGPVFLKIAVEVDPILPPGWDGKLPAAVIHFTSARGNEKRAAAVTPGLRVLSVDLGLRNFAACSVLELRDLPPAPGKLAYRVEAAAGGLWAVHERSFVLHLPGEVPDPQGEAWRAAAATELQTLRRGLNRYKRLYQSGHEGTPEGRQQRVAELQEALREVGWPFEERLLESLAPCVPLTAPEWATRVDLAVREFRQEFGRIVRDWRRRSRAGDKVFGKSVWAIEYLTKVRLFLVSWSLSGERFGDIRRLDRDRRGTFAARLLNHINGIKEDRLKTGADLIVQAARGYLRGDTGEWRQQYTPCHAVLFEDLARYRMKSDRPRRENSQLMLWAHRQIPEEVKMQGEVYGINLCHTGAAFSSRYHAATNTPGIRCHPVTVEDLSNEFFRQYVERENPGIAWERLHPGDLIPFSSGELFAYLTGTGKLIIHADINAAQNLQRRFWTRHAEPFRLPARRMKVNGAERWLPYRLGKRLLGGLGGYGLLIPTGHESGSCRWSDLTPAQWRNYGGELRKGEPALDDVDAVEEMTEDLLEQSGEVVVFFRDPSGVVLPKGLWYPAKFFWSRVKTQTTQALLPVAFSEKHDNVDTEALQALRSSVDVLR